MTQRLDEIKMMRKNIRIYQKKQNNKENLSRKNRIRKYCIQI